MGLPILAIIVLGMCGSVQKISDHVNKKFYTVMIGAIMILCCCVSIPRTAAVGIEMGLQGIWSGAPYLVFVILYFVIAFLFAKDRGTALDKVGKILTPIMTIILFILVVKGAVSPIGTPGAASVDNAFVNSFLGGYSTGDVLVSFLAAGVFFDSIKRKGYEGEAFRKAHVRACLIAAVCLDDQDQPYYITLKLDPAEGDFLRGQYEDILPGYYMNKTHWNSVRAQGSVPDDLLRNLLDEAYRLVLRALPKKKQREITGE